MPGSQPILIPEVPPDLQSGRERIHGLDFLRSIAMLAGVYLHAAISFMEATFPWAIHDRYRSAMFDLSVGIIHGFRMQLFFVLAGFFARLVHDRMGTGPFLRRRGLRIGVPFLVGLVTLLPLVFVVWGWGLVESGQPLDGALAQSPKSALDYPTGHLWFLEYLLLFYLLIGVRQPAVRALARLAF